MVHLYGAFNPRGSNFFSYGGNWHNIFSNDCLWPKTNILFTDKIKERNNIYKTWHIELNIWIFFSGAVLYISGTCTLRTQINLEKKCTISDVFNLINQWFCEIAKILPLVISYHNIQYASLINFSSRITLWNSE